MRLKEIEYLRPILFIHLFFVHAFTIYTESSWELPLGIEHIEIYDWIHRISNSCMLELFTFISGYVYYHVSIRKKQTFKQLCTVKIQRLLIPSIVFSILYYLLFINEQLLSWNLCYDILCGIGHLWYLPMLFICFLIAYFIKDFKKSSLLLIITLVISSFSRCPNIFRISQVAYYFFFFYLGIYVYQNKEGIQKALSTKKLQLLLFILYLSLCSVLLPSKENLENVHINTWFGNYLLAALIRFINIVYAIFGIFFWYSFALRIAKRHQYIPSHIQQFNILSMGVYIAHQFILMYLYYHTKLPETCGSVLLPWFALIIVIPSSILVSHFIRTTKIGKALT